MLDLRTLFNSIQVLYKDRGPNCSRGHINIRCPWCGDRDPSHHLTISEEKLAYYCFREPRHSGRSLPWLLRALGCSPAEITRLLAPGAGSRAGAVPNSAPPANFNWGAFAPVANSPAALAYLGARGYAQPKKLSRDFDLRFTPNGRFSWRILFPLTAGGAVIGATGRAMRAHIEPRYLTIDPYGGALYVPRQAPHTHTLLLCEGPFDALTVAQALPPTDCIALALLGTQIPDKRKTGIARLVRAAHNVVYVQDSDQPVSTVYRLIEELGDIQGMPHIRRLKPPNGYKDLGELASRIGELRAWLIDTLPNGRAPLKTMPAPLP